MVNDAARTAAYRLRNWRICSDSISSYRSAAASAFSHSASVARMLLGRMG